MDIKVMKKIFVCLFVLFLGLSVSASSTGIIKKAVQKVELSRTALISVSFKDIKTGKTVVDYNSKLPVSVASVQKVVTTIPAVNKLGKEYDFQTKLYKKNNDIYIQLGADPYFTSRDLKNMFRELSKYNIEVLDHIYIDDSITDRVEWGEGWQWDNTLNYFMPKFGAYNIDSNLIKVIVRPTSVNLLADVYTDVFYPIVFRNNVITKNATNLKFVGNIQLDVIDVSGTVAKRVERIIPINDLRKYFILRLKECLSQNKIAYYGKFERANVPEDAILVAVVKNNIEKVVYDILKKSDNMMSETLFKVAGGGVEENSIKMFENYYTQRNLDISGIKITDASGVSKNNLLNANFITSVLVDDFDNSNSIKKYMAVPGEGTLSNRMFYFKDNLIAKTGTLQNVSAIAGYLTTESGNVYAFCIVVNDAKSSSFEKKSFEEYVIRTAYETL